MQGTEIAQLFASISADVGDFDKAMKQIDDKLSATEKGMTGLQNLIGNGLKVAAGVGVAAIGGLAAGLGVAISKSVDMEQGVANIGASMQLASGDVAKLQDYILDLGLDPNLVVDAQGAAEAIGTLGTAGLTLDQIMGGAAKSTILLSNATGGSFADSAALMTDIMGQFNIEATDTGRILDQITGLTVQTKFGFTDVAGAFAQVGSVAASVGLSLEDTAAMLAVTSTNFASGSDQATSMKTFLQRLVPTTNEATDAMRALGLANADGTSRFFEANGAIKSAAEIAELMQQAFGGLSDAQRIEAASTIFGTDAMRFAFGVMDSGGASITNSKKLIGDTSAEDMAKMRMDTLSGSWGIFTGIVETLQIGIGQKFLPVAKKLLDWIIDLAQTYGPPVVEWAGTFASALETTIGWLSETVATGTLFNDKFGEMPAPIQAVVLGISNVIDGVTGFIAGVKETFAPITDLISKFVSWQDVLNAVGLVVASIVIPAIWGFIAAAAPIIALFAAIVAASALLRNAWENDWLGIRSAITYAWDVIAGVFNSVMIKVEWIVDTFRSEWAVLIDTNASLGQKLSLIWNMIKDLAVTVWQGIVTTVQILWPKFRDAVLEWGTMAWKWLSDAIPIALKQIGEWGTALIGWVTANAARWLQQLATWGKAAWQWIADIVPVALQKLGEWGGAIFQWLGDKLPDFLKMVFEWGTALYTWIGNVIPNAINALADFIHGIRTKGEGEGTSAFSKMAGAWATKLWTWITDDLIPAVGPAFMSFIQAMGSYGLDLLAALGYLATELGLLLWEWIVAATPPALQKLEEWGTQLMGWISDNMPAWVTKLQKWAAAAWQWIVDATGPALTKLGEWGNRLWQWIVDNSPAWAAKLGQWAKAAWQWIVEMTPIAVEKLREMGGRLMSWIVENAPEWGRKFLDAGRNIVQGLWDGIREKWNNFTDWFGGVWGGLVDRFKNFFGIHSPSALFAMFGESMMQGLQSGITSAAQLPINAMDAISLAVQGKVTSMVGAVADSARTIANTIKSMPALPEGYWSTPVTPVTTPTPVVTMPVPTTPNEVYNGGNASAVVSFGSRDLDLMLNSLAAYVDVTDTLQDIQDFAGLAKSLLGTNAPSSSPEGIAVSSLLSGGLSNLSVDRVLSAIQLLIRKIDEQGLGSRFNISAAPDASLQQQTELEELVSYLNALYG